MGTASCPCSFTVYILWVENWQVDFFSQQQLLPRVGAPHGCFQGSLLAMGHVGCRSVGILVQCKTRQVNFQDQESLGVCSRCPGAAWDLLSVMYTFLSLQFLLCPHHNTPGWGNTDSDHTSCSQINMVFWQCQHVDRHSLGASNFARSPFAKSDLPSFYTVAGFDSMALEGLGVSDAIIPTLLWARKAHSRKIYHRTWKNYVTRCESRKFQVCCGPYFAFSPVWVWYVTSLECNQGADFCRGSFFFFNGQLPLIL